jgi:hypothetical protein
MGLDYEWGGYYKVWRHTDFMDYGCIREGETEHQALALGKFRCIWIYYIAFRKRLWYFWEGGERCGWGWGWGCWEWEREWEWEWDAWYWVMTREGIMKYGIYHSIRTSRIMDV